MKDLWILSVKTSLSDVCWSVGDLKTDFFAYSCFENAVQGLRAKLKEFAFTKNSLFDGDGNMIYFKQYVDDAFEPHDDEEQNCGDYLCKAWWLKIYTALKAVFEGKICDISEFEDYRGDDGMIGVSFKGDAMTIRGEDDGPCNGYDPLISTNMFDMSQEKDYYLYIDDCFGQDDATSELYIDLKKVTLE